MSPPVLGIIPARIGSSRLPRKPLHPLAGRPLLEWVWRSVLSMEILDRVVIATDSEEVRDVARAFGAEVVLTAAEHPSGTDRVAEVTRRPEYEGFPVVLNVQGDEPFVRRGQVEAALACVRGGGWEIGTAAAPLASAAEWRDPSVVKVVRGDEGGALYFSRAPVPFLRDGEPGTEEWASGVYLRHIGIYAYRREVLLRWVALPEGTLERIERLEQLRPLAAGMRIGVGMAERGEGGVDTPADAERAEQSLRQQLLHAAGSSE
ncbi:MAG: 3-deoxy-manno-octulosonate cytidylyltransferase [Gemmatimonadota bacterium]|nr:3-deoxy-manno-octulosonate cytidylyltransferase [Gemmatimonadota bacterium]